MNVFILSQANDILFTADNHVTDHVFVYRTRSSTINKPPSECMSFITWSGKKFLKKKKKKNRVALFVKYVKNNAN